MFKFLSSLLLLSSVFSASQEMKISSPPACDTCIFDYANEMKIIHERLCTPKKEAQGEFGKLAEGADLAGIAGLLCNTYPIGKPVNAVPDPVFNAAPCEEGGSLIVDDGADLKCTFVKEEDQCKLKLFKCESVFVGAP